MGDGTEESPFSHEDVLRLIEENNGTIKGLDLSGKWFEQGIDLHRFNNSGLEELVLKGADLRRAHLKGAELWDADLEGANLWEANLEGASLAFANLEGANLLVANLQKAYLVDANLDEAALVDANLEKANLFEASLKGAVLLRANLEGAILVKADLKGAIFVDANLKNVYLVWAQFSADTDFNGTNWGDYILGEEKKGDFDLAKDVYWRLRHWHTNAGIHDIAAKFFYREMEAKRKAQSWTKNPHLKLWSWVLRLLCGYGEKPERVIIWTVSVILSLTLIYFIIGSLWEWTAFWRSLYFSAVSFTALGYGNWLDTNNDWMGNSDWIRGIGAFESFIGVFSIALFLVTFTRKMTR